MRQLKINKSITPRSEESLDKYLTEISRVPMVSMEEEIVLAQAIHAGGKKGQKAKDKLNESWSKQNDLITVNTQKLEETKLRLNQLGAQSQAEAANSSLMSTVM